MSLPKCKDFTDYNKYPGEADPTTDAQMQEYMDNQNQLMKAASAMMWQPSTEYEVGDIIVSPAMPANTEAVCLTAGMTDSVLEPSWAMGNNIPDGSCFWKLRYVHYTSFLATEEEAAAGTDTEKIMTPATSKHAIEKLGGIPIGHEWFTTNPNIPTGCLPLFGGTFSRTAYKDLWAWVQAQGKYLISEAEWQEKAAANEGNVAFYSDGDGSTTFRVPSLKCHVQGANGVEEVGSYLKAGLPNITGDSYSIFAGGAFSHAGSLKQVKEEPATSGKGTDGNNWVRLYFDASWSNDIYGNSDTVQPPSIVGMYLVKAFGTVSNVGNQDVADISAGLTNAETRLAEAETNIANMPFTARATSIGGASTTKPAVVVTTYRSGYNWYRKYSDGWIEQGGRVTNNAYGSLVTVNLPTAFATTEYTIMQNVHNSHASAGSNHFDIQNSNITTTSFAFRTEGKDNVPSALQWYACGY